MLGLALAWVCLGQPVLDDPCSEASTSCRRAAQAKILEWRAEALSLRAEVEDLNSTLNFVLTATAGVERPGLALIAETQREELETDGPGFWTGVLVGVAVAGFAAGGVGLALALR